MKLGSPRVRRDQTSFGSLDYLLMGLGNCFAVYSAGMAVGAQASGRVFLAMIILGTLFSLAVRRFFSNSKLLGWDATLYTAATACAVLFASRLNVLLPEDGVPADVTTAGWLCWMLAFGSFLTWRDRTLLFQAVPTIALFGLIGCYDTYAPAPFLFFGFLLCLATLLGRSHSRDMLRQAVQSGYFNRADSPLTISEHPEQSSELYEDIKRGPWRWLAGPEWALGSGLVIVIFSLLGAPVIRRAVEPISGAIKVFTPQRMRSSYLANRAASVQSTYEVGRGPLTNANATPRPQFIARMDKIRYLRTSVFDLYTGRGWSSSVPSLMPPNSSGLGDVAIAEMDKKNTFTMTIARQTSSDSIPLPAEVTSISPAGTQLNSGGSALSESARDVHFEIDGVEATGTPSKISTDLPDEIRDNCLDRSKINENVVKFAKDSLPQTGTDYEKAMALQTAISRRCNYFKGASAVPADRDAADYFLNDSRVGYCDLFATAMTECARAVGMPAHFCIGYLPDPKYSDSHGQTIIYDQDYHAWSEIYFQGVGWVVFDATAGATSLDPDKGSTSNSGFADIATIVLDGLIGVGVLAAGALYILPRVRKRKPTSSTGDRSEVGKIYLSFSRSLDSATRERRQVSETAEEYIIRLHGFLGDSQPFALAINRQLEAALYGPQNPTSESLKSLTDEVKRFRQLLKRHVAESKSHMKQGDAV